MNVETLRQYFLSNPAVTESFPFGDQTLVFKVMGKMFGLIALEDHPPRMNLKCDPEKAMELRESHACVAPGFHMNKRHWNTVTVDGSASWEEYCSWIDS